MNFFRKIAGLALIAAMVPGTNVNAQILDDVEAYFDATFVSHYVWRGQDKGGVSIQPMAYVSWQGLTLRADGNVGFEPSDEKELNLTLGYDYSGFNIGVIDYWTSGIDKHDRYFQYDKRGAHQLEANLGYVCKYGSLQAYTIFWGNDFTISGKQAYSTYVELEVPFKLAGLDWNVGLGMTPFESAGEAVPYVDEVTGLEKAHGEYYYANGPAFVMASLRATKTLDLNIAHLPIFAELNANPYRRTATFLVGFTITPF